MDSRKQVTCGWFQKPTDTNIHIIFRACSSLQCKINLIEGTVCRVLRKTSTWVKVDSSLEKKVISIKNQYPENCLDRKVFEIPNKTIEIKNILEVTASKQRKVAFCQNDPKRMSSMKFFLEQFKGKIGCFERSVVLIVQLNVFGELSLDLRNYFQNFEFVLLDTYQFFFREH